MFKNKKILAVMAAVVAAMGMAQPAQARVRDWLNDMTTFNEDQKRPVNKYPQANPPPSIYYDPRSGDDWSQFYTGSTSPQPYLNGSASMVVRPVGSELPEPSALGYDVFARRHYLNNNQPTGNVMIGEPGMGSNGYGADDNTMIAMAPETRAKTYIGNPKEHWRNGPSGPYITARPGDFDYRGGAEADSRMAKSSVGDDIAPVKNGGAVVVGDPKYQGDGSTSYTVERGDSLSGISDKPKIYGDWKLWPLLYDANRGTIGHDPVFIKPGQNLGVPRDVTQADADKAIKQAKNKKAPHRLHDGK